MRRGLLIENEKEFVGRNGFGKRSTEKEIIIGWRQRHHSTRRSCHLEMSEEMIEKETIATVLLVE